MLQSMRSKGWFLLAAAAALVAFGAFRPAVCRAASDAPALTGGAPGGVLAQAEPKVVTKDKSFTGKLKELWAELKKGGRTMYLLLFLSVMGLAFLLERLFRLRQGVIVPKGLAAQASKMWRDGRLGELEKLDQQNKSTLARVVSYVVKHRHAPVSDVSAGAGDIAARDLRRHLQRAYPLAVVATLSPLLGLFGTVIGIMEAFEQLRREAVTSGLADPQMFAGAISKALVTTATGLAIAIPTLGFYHWFKSRTTMYGMALEEQAGDLISEWLLAAEPQAEPEAKPVEKPKPQS